MRARLLVVTAFLLLAACDAGTREGDSPAPGDDNTFPGPELAITAPGPGQRLPAGANPPVVMFDLRNTQAPERRKGDFIRFFVDDGAAVRVDDHTRPTSLAGSLAPGKHVIRAEVVKSDGTPYANPESKAERVFHVGK